MRPALGASKPANILSKVLLPEPEPPSKQKSSFWYMSSDTLLTAVKSPNRLLMFSIFRKGTLSGWRQLGKEEVWFDENVDITHLFEKLQ
ncbi:hypothetical protein THO17_13470 [Marinomonas sp. THO17]